jgi:hypothetical protein
LLGHLVGDQGKLDVLLEQAENFVVGILLLYVTSAILPVVAKMLRGALVVITGVKFPNNLLVSNCKNKTP